MEFKLSGVRKVEKNDQPIENLLVLGSGPAGYAAALYAARAELNPLILTGLELGGQAALTYTIENYPGFPDGVGGAALGELFQKQAEKFGARIEFDSVTSVDLSEHPFTVRTYSNEFKTKALVIATGASPVHLDVPGEKELTGRGVSYCATCDGYFFKEKKVVVVGGGDSAIEEGIFLTRYASSVTIIHRREELRAGAILQKRASENPKISFVLNTVVKEVKGSEKVESIVLENVNTGETTNFPVDGIFIFIGHQPNTKIFEGQVKLDSKGYIVSDSKMQTSVKGVFAAGEVTDPIYRQVVTSAGMGAAAGIMAAKYLEENE